MARERGGPALAGQVLLYPVIEPVFDVQELPRFGAGHFNTRAAMEWYWRQYLGDVDVSADAPTRGVRRPARAAAWPGCRPRSW